jgi:hypothetical protein
MCVTAPVVACAHRLIIIGLSRVCVQIVSSLACKKTSTSFSIHHIASEIQQPEQSSKKPVGECECVCM